MVHKLSGFLVLMTAMLGGCAVWTRTPAHQASVDYSDRAFYDRPYASSPAYTANFVQNAKIVDDAPAEQPASTLAKTAPEQKSEGAGADFQVEIPVPPPVSEPPAKRASQGEGAVPRQTTSPGENRSGRSSSSISAAR
jgi:hypothetical protein